MIEKIKKFLINTKNHLTSYIMSVIITLLSIAIAQLIFGYGAVGFILFTYFMGDVRSIIQKFLHKNLFGGE